MFLLYIMCIGLYRLILGWILQKVLDVIYLLVGGLLTAIVFCCLLPFTSAQTIKCNISVDG